jgi:hypothetical protein
MRTIKHIKLTKTDLYYIKLTKTDLYSLKYRKQKRSTLVLVQSPTTCYKFLLSLVSLTDN